MARSGPKKETRPGEAGIGANLPGAGLIRDPANQLKEMSSISNFQSPWPG